jgi:hypothetical protein
VAPDSLIYALIQMVHNLSAALALGAPLFRVWYGTGRVAPARVVHLLLTVWGLQILTGTAFGAASLWFYGALPDLYVIAKAALAVKITCAAGAVGLCAWLLRHQAALQRRASWSGLALLAATAISAAAVLRWFS